MDEIGQTTQVCTGCGEAKPLAEFDVRADTGKHRTTCKDCRRTYQKSRWLWCVNPERSTRAVGSRELFPCRSCGQMKPAVDFQLRHRDSNRLQSWCRQCLSAYKAARHIRFHEREIARIRRNQKGYVARNVELIREYLSTHPCVDCGETDPIVLDFDHLRDKEYEVSRLVYTGHPWARILKEIAKCEVRCSNDHRRATHRRKLEAKRLQEERGAWLLAS